MVVYEGARTCERCGQQIWGRLISRHTRFCKNCARIRAREQNKAKDKRNNPKRTSKLDFVDEFALIVDYAKSTLKIDG